MARKSNPENDFVVSPQGASAGSRRKPARARAKHTAVPSEPQVSEPETPVVQAVETVSEVATYEPTHEEIAERAYLLWEARGCQGGSPEEDWLQAEQELRQRISSTATA